MSELADANRRLARSIEGNTRRVDEYQAQGYATYATTAITLQPQFEQFFEVIRRIIVIGPAVPSLAPSTVRGTVTDPAANATIATAGTLLKGVEYQYSWAAELEGTVAAGDADNMKITGPSGLSEGAAYPGVVGLYEQNGGTVVGDGVTSLVVKAIAAASGASAIYGAQIVATPLAPQFTLQLGDRFWNLALPATGLLEFSADILLSRNDLRQLTSPLPGSWSLELTGEADVRNRS